MKTKLRLKNFPISFFAPILGLAGFSLGMQKTESLFSLPSSITIATLSVTIFLFVFISLLYFLKILFFSKEVKKEYQHPIKINFFPLFSKIFLVLSIIFLDISMVTSKWLWLIGLIINAIFSISILGEWISREHFKIKHMSPAWFIPVVGNLIVPIAGVQHMNSEISWFFFAIGITWMAILTTIIIYRLVFHEPLMQKLLPTLFILFAAPAIAFISYYKLTGDFDSFAHILYYFATFLFILIISKWRLFLKIDFYLSWWAYTFPLAAFFLSTALVYHITEIALFKFFGLGLISILSIFIFALGFKTIKAISNKQICVED